MKHKLYRLSKKAAALIRQHLLKKMLPKASLYDRRASN